MLQTICSVSSVEHVGQNIFVLGFHSPEIAASTEPGQFLNIKVNGTYQPLFRRPFSVYHIENETVKIIFQVFGLGTQSLVAKEVGEKLDVLGPLGCGFNYDDGFEHALLVGGGLGVAPLPVLTQKLRHKKTITTFLGARTTAQIIPSFLHNLQIATDDGSQGLKGTVVSLLEEYLQTNTVSKPKIFACGPNVMLNALGKLAQRFNIPCEISLETTMACGIGICQGCPVERVEQGKKYSLCCKDGPVFEVRRVKFD